MPVNGGRCEQCDATVEWVTTERNSKPMPLDVGTDPAGNVVMVPTPAGPRARVFGRGREPDVPGDRRISHYATCPRDRDVWLQRRGGRRRPARQSRRRFYR